MSEPTTSIGIDWLEQHGFAVSEAKKKPKAAAPLYMILLSVLAGVLSIVLPITLLSGALTVAEPAADFWKSLPQDMDEVAIAERNVVYDADGNVIAQFWSEDRIQLNSVDEISDYALKGLVATEDKRFYEHGGFDPMGTLRALVSSSGGGSGITQQLVKNLQFYNLIGRSDEQQSAATEQSLNRKLRELRYAMQYEKTHTKDEIILSYFNTVAFGAPNIYSIESAAQYFFGKSAKELTLAESAALVGTVQNPSAYNLNNAADSTEWKDRQKVVLDRMFAEGDITRDEAKSAAAEELKFVYKESSGGNCASSKYPAYCDSVIDALLDSPRLGETREDREVILARGGLQIHTALKQDLMDMVDSFEESTFGNENRLVAPVAVVDPKTGGVVASGVNRDYGKGAGKTTIDLTNNPSSTGSTYKLITLAAALENGFSPSDLTFSSPCPYSPEGYDAPSGGFSNSSGCGYQNGTLDYQKATAWSSNTWYVKLATMVGMDAVFDMSKSMGLSVPDYVSDRSLSFVLGSVENSPVDMAAAYATFANGGVYCPPSPVTSFKYADGSEVAVPDTYTPESESCRRVMSPATASTVLKAMRANTVPGYVDNAFGLVANVPGYDTVGKSGTNEKYNFTWGQVSRNYSMFINIYDADNYNWGVPKVSNMATASGSQLMRQIVTTHETDRLDFSSTDTSLKPVAVPSQEYTTVPSVIGMTPEQAVEALEATGLPVHVSTESAEPRDGIPSGVVSTQSVDGGTKVPVGATKEIILHVSP